MGSGMYYKAKPEGNIMMSVCKCIGVSHLFCFGSLKISNYVWLSSIISCLLFLKLKGKNLGQINIIFDHIGNSLAIHDPLYDTYYQVLLKESRLYVVICYKKQKKLALWFNVFVYRLSIGQNLPLMWTYDE